MPTMDGISVEGSLSSPFPWEYSVSLRNRRLGAVPGYEGSCRPYEGLDAMNMMP